MQIHKLVLVLMISLLPLSRQGFAQTVNCSSEDGRRHYCAADTRHGVTLVKQRSEAACTQGVSWDADERGIWVDHGCRADFSLQTLPPAERIARTITCSSDDGGRHHCNAETRGGVWLVNQRSSAVCNQGYSWDVEEHGIWVDRGCRADFAIGREDYREVPRHDERHDERHGERGEAQIVKCSSDDGRRNFCRVEIHGGVRLVNQRSEAACRQGYSWDFDEGGIWVDHGCRADFAVEEHPHGNGHDEEDRDRGESCARSAGEDRANRLEQECLRVAPGAHPPCSAQNSCKVITEEIRRGCAALGSDAPRFCDEYR